MDISIAAAMIAGLVSFLSPCVLPIVPGYLSYLSGISPFDAGAGPAGTGRRSARRRAVARNAGAFVSGFTTIFVLLGASASAIGRFLSVHGNLFAKVAGAVIVVFGLHMIGVLRIPILYREQRIQAGWRPRTLLGSYAIGMAFAFGWTPCIGPILASVLTIAATRDTVVQGMGLLLVYSLGLGVPFLLAAFGFEYLTGFIANFRRYFRAVEIGSGMLLVSVGVLIFSGHLAWLSQRLTFLNRFVL